MRGFGSADHKLDILPIAVVFMWDVFVGELGVVCNFSLKHLVTGKLSRHRNMDLKQLKWPQKKESGWWLLSFPFMLCLSVLQVPHLTTTLVASLLSDFILGTILI